MNTSLFRAIAAGAVLLVALSGCQSTSIQSAWFDPAYTGGPMKKIDVVGVGSGNVSDRRVFEDIFAQKLGAAGVDGVPGYTVMADDARVRRRRRSPARSRSRARRDSCVVRLLGVDTKTQVSTTMVPGGGPGWGPGYGPGYGPYGGFYGPAWYPVTQVSQYDVASVEASLYDVKTRRLIWSATTQTMNPQSVAQETPGFADLIIKQLVGARADRRAEVGAAASARALAASAACAALSDRSRESASSPRFRRTSARARCRCPRAR